MSLLVVARVPRAPSWGSRPFPCLGLSEVGGRGEGREGRRGGRGPSEGASRPQGSTCAAVRPLGSPVSWVVVARPRVSHLRREAALYRLLGEGGLEPLATRGLEPLSWLTGEPVGTRGRGSGHYMLRYSHAEGCAYVDVVRGRRTCCAYLLFRVCACVRVYLLGCACVYLVFHVCGVCAHVYVCVGACVHRACCAPQSPCSSDLSVPIFDFPLVPPSSACSSRTGAARLDIPLLRHHGTRLMVDIPCMGLSFLIPQSMLALKGS